MPAQRLLPETCKDLDVRALAAPAVRQPGMLPDTEDPGWVIATVTAAARRRCAGQREQLGLGSGRSLSLASVAQPDPAAPTFGGGMAAWGTLKARYTLLDVPGAGVAVIWSWTFDRLAVLDDNQAFVDSVTLG
jgi:hypothetical protein